jgi:hypothetical protein
MGRLENPLLWGFLEWSHVFAFVETRENAGPATDAVMGKKEHVPAGLR